ncbi:MAG: autotransporter-associated beta strand repeat-containing protein, partial [Tepidisphaeraceae bacterium]
MQRASNQKTAITGAKSQPVRIARRAALLASAVAGSMTLVSAASGATVTWAGTIQDPNSGSYTVTAQGTAGGLLNGTVFNWDTTTANWTGAPTYTALDNAVFTDNFAGGRIIRLPSSSMNPTSMTFAHIAGAAPATYTFIRGGTSDADLQLAAVNLTSNTMFGAQNPSTAITLDTGFLGHVKIRARANSGALNGNTIIRSGILEINDALALPGSTSTNSPLITLDGGELRINVNTAGNTQPAATNLTGALTVLSNSTLANGETTRASGATIYNGAISMGAGITLTVKSVTPIRANFSNTNFNAVAGTIALADDIPSGNITVAALGNGSNQDALNALIDLGSGSSELLATTATVQYDFGALTGGANTKLSGSTAAGVTTYAIGARGDSTTYAGTIRSGLVGTTALSKNGTGTLTLTGTNTYTGPTAANAGSIVLTGALGSATTSSATLGLGGTLRLDNASANN